VTDTSNTQALALSDILDAMSEADVQLKHDVSGDAHIARTDRAELFVWWQTDCEDAGWSWRLREFDAEGYTTHEESSSLDSLKELKSLLEVLA
jgi:hypothetical protein